MDRLEGIHGDWQYMTAAEAGAPFMEYADSPSGGPEAPLSAEGAAPAADTPDSDPAQEPTQP